ncbi:DUF484 family protein [Congregibacter sp.]|uniref:DUF484 family protein n=1 Tax=Congregibacter sp. TaxID=2744308 RepID=UPI003F6B03DD
MDEDDIRDFLVQNPDYFQKNPELLGLIQIPHSTGAAVSLVERQVSVLRDRNVDLRHRLRDLGSTAKDNDQMFADTRELVLGLLPAKTLDELHDALIKVLRDVFDIEYASLTLFNDSDEAPDSVRRVPESQLKGKLGSLLVHGTAGCGALRAEDFEFLFPGARIVGSAAIAVIESDGKALGALAVGSSNASHYDGDMGTLFLEFAAEVIAGLLVRIDGS